MSRAEEVRKGLKEELKELTRDPLAPLNPHVYEACSNTIDDQLACLFGELVDEICAIRKELVEMNHELSKIEKGVSKK